MLEIHVLPSKRRQFAGACVHVDAEGKQSAPASRHPLVAHERQELGRPKIRLRLLCARVGASYALGGVVLANAQSDVLGPLRVAKDGADRAPCIDRRLGRERFPVVRLPTLDLGVQLADQALQVVACDLANVERADLRKDVALQHGPVSVDAPESLALAPLAPPRRVPGHGLAMPIDHGAPLAEIRRGRRRACAGPIDVRLRDLGVKWNERSRTVCECDLRVPPALALRVYAPLDRPFRAANAASGDQGSSAFGRLAGLVLDRASAASTSARTSARSSPTEIVTTASSGRRALTTHPEKGCHR